MTRNVLCPCWTNVPGLGGPVDSSEAGPVPVLGGDCPRRGHDAGPSLALHVRPALVADRRRDGVQGPACGTGLRPHLPHLLFLSEPVLERHERGLAAPPVLELALREGPPELAGGFLPELRRDIVVLHPHLLLVVRHLDLPGRELHAALRALSHL